MDRPSWWQRRNPETFAHAQICTFHHLIPLSYKAKAKTTSEHKCNIFRDYNLFLSINECVASSYICCSCCLAPFFIFLLLYSIKFCETELPPCYSLNMNATCWFIHVLYVWSSSGRTTFGECLCLVSIAVINTLTKSNFGGKGLFGLCVPIKGHTDRSQDGNSRQEPGGQN